MYSSNPSYESLREFQGDSLYKSSQINPNLSTTNLQSLSKLHGGILEPHPNKYGFPITPPVSKSGTPIKDDKFPRPPQEYLHNKIIILCINWYISSIVSNYSTKLILLDFTYPITLTQFQFILNSVFCLFLLHVLIRDYNGSHSLVPKFPTGSIPVLKNLTIRRFIIPDEFILRTTVPMGIFQFVGHVTSHNATSVIPVSLNHTIKALSPITTVLIYKIFFNKKYATVTYLTLIPLMVGIMLTCYKSGTQIIENYWKGLMFSFVSMLIFVSQNIFAKSRLTIKSTHVLPNHNKVSDKKLDKLSILYYCSMVGFVFTLPIYLILEYKNPHLSIFDLNAYNSGLILINGLSHFFQSLLAFQILGVISPINYSIANIFKRIIIILVAFIIEGKPLTPNQVVGIVLTVAGLFAYDRYGLKKL